ncbi:hypothetical protein BDZ97DRAFT_1845783 [Flammula alnicola]|nr:hypothetical protein BDZ97DRAFT_1845783 [Flammula alnicola]
MRALMNLRPMRISVHLRLSSAPDMMARASESFMEAGAQLASNDTVSGRTPERLIHAFIPEMTPRCPQYGCPPSKAHTSVFEKLERFILTICHANYDRHNILWHASNGRQDATAPVPFALEILAFLLKRVEPGEKVIFESILCDKVIVEAADGVDYASLFRRARCLIGL